MDVVSQLRQFNIDRRSRSALLQCGRQVAATLLALVLIVGEPLICVLHCDLDELMARPTAAHQHNHTGHHGAAMSIDRDGMPHEMPGQSTHEPLYEHLGLLILLILLALTTRQQPLPRTTRHRVPLLPSHSHFRPPILIAS